MAATVSLEYYRGIRSRKRHLGEGILACAWDLTMRNKRRFGGYIVHLGMALIFVGVAASSTFKQVGEVRLRTGESFALNGLQFRFESLKEGRTPEYRSVFARLGVYKEGNRLGEVVPERRLYFTPPQPTTEAGIRRSFQNDIYAVFAEVDQDGSASFQFFVNPLISWIWFGGGVFTLGSIVCFLPQRWGRLKKGASQEAAA